MTASERIEAENARLRTKAEAARKAAEDAAKQAAPAPSPAEPKE